MGQRNWLTVLVFQQYNFKALSFAMKNKQQLYGVAPVIEALRSGARKIESITVADGVQSSRLRVIVFPTFVCNPSWT